MQIELNAGAVTLGPNQTLRVLDGAGRTVCAVQGAVWITEENDPNDIVLEAGHCYRLKHEGLAVLNSLSGAASVSLARMP
jgi:Protein of unknown function (DUF2917)